MDGLYSDKNMREFCLSSDDDDNLEAGRSPTSLLYGSRKKHRSNEGYPFVQEPMRSKYDHRPRNVVLGEDGFSSFSPRRSKVKKPSGRGEYSDVVPLGSEVKGHANEVIGQSDVVRGRSDRVRGLATTSKGRVRSGCAWFLCWLGRMEWLSVLVLACVFGVAFGILYRGGLTGEIYLRLSSKGKRIIVTEWWTGFHVGFSPWRRC